MKADWNTLIQRYRDGSATPEEATVLQQALTTDAELRALYLDYMNLDMALDAAADAMEMIPKTPPLTATTKPRNVWFQWRPLTAAAAGVVFGMCSASMVWAYVGPYAGKAMILLQESFESGTAATMPGLPREASAWFGDEARVVTMEQGLKPKSGEKMLRFVSATFAGENAKRSAWGDVYRLVDLRGQVGDAKAVLRLSASFDAVRFPAGEEYSCSVELCALDVDLAGAPQPLALPWVRENSASTALRKFPMKGDGVWQEATVEVPVSPQTRFILVHLAVLRVKPFPPAEPVQFGGHYLDDVKLELLTKPNMP